MSIKLMTEVWELDLSQTRKLIFLAYADYANDDGVCWPSNETIAEKTGVSKRTVTRHVSELKEQGYMEVIEEGGGRSSTNKVRVMPKKGDIVSGFRDEKGDTGDENHDTRDEKGEALSKNHDTAMSTKPSKNRQEEPSKESSDSACVKEIFNHWVSKDNTISHRCFTEAFKKSIRARLNDGWSKDELQEAIDNYDMVLGSDDYFFTYDNWTLKEFLSREEGAQAEKFLTNPEGFMKEDTEFGQNGSGQEESRDRGIDYQSFDEWEEQLESEEA